MAVNLKIKMIDSEKRTSFKKREVLLSSTYPITNLLLFCCLFRRLLWGSFCCFFTRGRFALGFSLRCAQLLNCHSPELFITTGRTSCILPNIISGFAYCIFIQICHNLKTPIIFITNLQQSTVYTVFADSSIGIKIKICGKLLAIIIKFL